MRFWVLVDYGIIVRVEYSVRRICTMVNMDVGYDLIGCVDDGELFAGDNGRDRWSETQEVCDKLMERRLGKVDLRLWGGGLLGDGERWVWPVERLRMDQYGNVYYGLHVVLCDGDVWSWCERVRTVEWKKGYELGDGWDVVVRRLRERGLEACVWGQKEALARKSRRMVDVH